VATIAAGIADNTATTTFATSVIFLGSSGWNVPAFIVDSVTATAPNTCVAAANPPTCPASFQTVLRWGVAQQGFRNGSMTLLQAVESHAITNAAIGSPTIYYDSWEPPVAGGANVVTLADRAPTQSSTGVTNSSGTRQANLSAPYSMTQTVADADGDLAGQSLVWVFTAGANAGQWFQAGVFNMRATDGMSATTVAGGTGTPGPATAYYADWQTAQTSFAVGSATTVGYFTQLTVSAPTQTTTTLSGGALGVTSQAVTYSFIYGTNAIGAVNLFGNASDWHGLGSGNVLVGTQTIT
jgi:hypothetical protein